MQRIRITVAYNGAPFEGWQKQACTHRPQPPTVQAEIEKALYTICQQHINVHGSGRTDTGVHAEAQVCHADVPLTKASVNWVKSLNALLPSSIRVHEVINVPAHFHARKSALTKQYEYSLCSGTIKPLPRIANYCWFTPPLNLNAMQEAANILIGTHDFASFQNTGTPLASTVRTIYAITPHHHTMGGMTCPESWNICTWQFEGNGFLKQMVRNIMGLLVWVGQGKLPVQQVEQMLAATSRKALPCPTAPPQGLTLVKVTYPPLY